MKMQKNKIAQNLMVLRHCINCPRKRWPGGSAFPGRLSQSGRQEFPSDKDAASLRFLLPPLLLITEL